MGRREWAGKKKGGREDERGMPRGREVAGEKERKGT